MATALEFIASVGNANDRACEISTPIGQTGTLDIYCNFKPKQINGTIQYLLVNDIGAALSNGSMALFINTSNQIVWQMGTNWVSDSTELIGPTLVQDTYYEVKIVITNIDTVANNRTANAEMFVNNVSQGTINDQDSRPLNNASENLKYLGGKAQGAPLVTVGQFVGYIYYARANGQTYDYVWDAASANTGNTGLDPVMPDTGIASNNFVGISDLDWPTDGTAWINDPLVGDTSPPGFTVSPAIVATTSGGHTIRSQINEDGTVYAVRLSNGAAAPSSAQVKAGNDSTDSAAPEAKSSAATTDTNVDLVFSTGNPSTPYDYYYVAEDDEGTPNIQASPTLIEGTTAVTSQAITITGGDLEAGNTEAGTYTNMTGVAATGTVTDSQGNQFSVTVTDGNDGTFTAAVPALPTSGTSNLGLFGNVTLQIDEAP
jgi:hypothetical protein